MTSLVGVQQLSSNFRRINYAINGKGLIELDDKLYSGEYFWKLNALTWPMFWSSNSPDICVAQPVQPAPTNSVLDSIK